MRHRFVASGSNSSRNGSTARALLALATLLALAAVALPPHALAASLAGAGSPHLAQVVAGAWIFKAMLLVHAGVLVAAARARPAADRAVADEPLANPPLREREPVARWELALLVALLAVGAALRLRALGAGLWYDEIAALVQYARLPLGQIITTYDSQNQHLLYSVLARLGVLAAGDGAVGLRLPAVAFGVASLWATWWFARRVTARGEALLATALLAGSYHHVWFSQNGRGYTGLLFWTLLATGLFLELVTRRDDASWRLVVAYAAVSALAAYTHVSAVFVTVSHLLVWLALAWRARARWRSPAVLRPLAAFALSATLALQLYALVLPQFVAALAGPPAAARVATEWKNPLWLAAETARGLARGLPGGPAFGSAALLVVLVVLGAGLASFWRRSRTATALMVLPGVITGGAMLAAEHNLWPRFFFFAAAFAVLVAMRGGFVLAGLLFGRWLGANRARSLAAVAAALVVAASAATVPRAWGPKQDFVGARAFIDARRAPDDAVVTVDLARFPYEAYLRTGWPAVGSAAELAGVERSHARTWVVYTFPLRLAAAQPEIWARLRAGYTTAARFGGTVGDGEVVVMVADRGTGAR